MHFTPKQRLGEDKGAHHPHGMCTSYMLPGTEEEQDLHKASSMFSTGYETKTCQLWLVGPYREFWRKKKNFEEESSEFIQTGCNKKGSTREFN